jgi:hypothetical protein
MQPNDSGPKFPPGQVVISANASRKLTTEDVTTALQRHLRADWGDLASSDPVENERCLLHACHLLSAYRSAKGERFWIITLPDRSQTQVLLPEDF